MIMNKHILEDNIVYYQNRYGKAKLTFQSAEMKISELNCKLEIVQNNIYTIDEIEQLALISDNYKIQPCSCYPDLTKWYVFYHTSSNTGYVCSMEIIEFKLNSVLTPAETIALANKGHPMMNTELYYIKGT